MTRAWRLWDPFLLSHAEAFLRLAKLPIRLLRATWVEFITFCRYSRSAAMGCETRLKRESCASSVRSGMEAFYIGNDVEKARVDRGLVMVNSTTYSNLSLNLSRASNQIRLIINMRDVNASVELSETLHDRFTIALHPPAGLPRLQEAQVLSRRAHNILPCMSRICTRGQSAEKDFFLPSRRTLFTI